MSPEQVEALAALVSAEMDDKLAAALKSPGAVDRRFLLLVMGKVMTELGESSAASRLMLLEKINALAQRVKDLEQRR